MDNEDFFNLPGLPYGLSALEPVISEKQLRIHYEKHHQSYVGTANVILERLDKSRREGTMVNVNAIARDLAFNVGGHILHSIFWPTMAPEGQGGEGPTGILAETINREFGNVERFKDEFSRTALGVQGSGWAVLTYEHQVRRLLITQTEKHDNNLFPTLPIVMVLDVWEHAYYLDYQNERSRYIQNWWRIVNWQAISERFAEMVR